MLCMVLFGLFVCSALSVWFCSVSMLSVCFYLSGSLLSVWICSVWFCSTCLDVLCGSVLSALSISLSSFALSVWFCFVSILFAAVCLVHSVYLALFCLPASACLYVCILSIWFMVLFCLLPSACLDLYIWFCFVCLLQSVCYCLYIWFCLSDLILSVCAFLPIRFCSVIWFCSMWSGSACLSGSILCDSICLVPICSIGLEHKPHTGKKSALLHGSILSRFQLISENKSFI